MFMELLLLYHPVRYAYFVYRLLSTTVSRQPSLTATDPNYSKPDHRITVLVGSRPTTRTFAACTDNSRASGHPIHLNDPSQIIVSLWHVNIDKVVSLKSCLISQLSSLPIRGRPKLQFVLFIIGYAVVDGNISSRRDRSPCLSHARAMLPPLPGATSGLDRYQ